MKNTSKSSNGLNSKDVAAKTAPISQNSEKATKLLEKAKVEPKAPKAPATAPKAKAPAAAPAAAPKGPTKKSVVIEMISTKKGAKIVDIAQTIVDRGMDADYDKNVRVVRLWLTKLGIPVEKLEGGYFRRKA